MSTAALIKAISSVPWGTVLETAPKVTEAAKKLWELVARKKSDNLENSNDQAVAYSTSLSLQGLQIRLSRVDERTLRLEEEIASSAELIKELAEQNAQLVRKIQQNSTRLNRLSMATLVFAVGLIGAIFYRG